MIRYIGNHLKKGSVALTVPFHMTSRQPCWYSKTMQPRPFWCSKPILWELNSFLMWTLSLANALLAQNEPWNALLPTRVIKIYVICYSACQNPMRILSTLQFSWASHCLKITTARGKMKRVKPDTCHMFRFTLTVDCSSNDQLPV